MSLELAIPELSVALPALGGSYPVTGKFQGEGAFVGELAMQTMEEKFWARVEKTATCWLWRGPKDRDGYSRHGKRASGHRFAYEIRRNRIPEGMTIDHLCRVRHCVNPDHMEIVTRKVNTLRGFGPSAVAARKTHCKNGHRLGKKSVRFRKWGIALVRVCLICQSAAVQRYKARRKST